MFVGFEFAPDSKPAIATVFIGVIALAVVGVMLAAKIYRSNELVITNESIIQVLQHSLFDRKVSQLNLARVQDVTFDQNGFLPTVLGFGTIKIETAGEAQNYNFPLTPDPTKVAKWINEAHEEYINLHGRKPNLASRHEQSGGI